MLKNASRFDKANKECVVNYFIKLRENTIIRAHWIFTIHLPSSWQNYL